MATVSCTLIAATTSKGSFSRGVVRVRGGSSSLMAVFTREIFVTEWLTDTVDIPMSLATPMKVNGSTTCRMARGQHNISMAARTLDSF